MNKHNLRQIYLIKRKNISSKKEKSTIIVEKIKNLSIYQESSVIAMYYAMNDEVDLSCLIKESLQNGKIVLLPKIVNDDLVFLAIDENTTYEKSKIGVMEPVLKSNMWHSEIDLMLVPGICFDRKNNRLGFGRGFYDRFLSEKFIYKIGVCFNEQITQYIPVEKHDIKMNIIISDK